MAIGNGNNYYYSRVTRHYNISIDGRGENGPSRSFSYNGENRDFQKKNPFKRISFDKSNSVGGQKGKNSMILENKKKQKKDYLSPLV